MNLGEAHIIQGNALNLPLPDSSVDLVCTSPPYFGLRSYQDGGAHYEGQIGSEATPAEFLDALIAATREMVRVLKPSGSIFVNLGDKYAGNHGTDRSRFDPKTITGAAWRTKLDAPKVADGGRPKSLLGIPWRYAIRCIDELGLILRAEIIWAKPNGLPESVTDRVRRSHEQWFHLTKQPRYFSAVDEIREPQKEMRTRRNAPDHRTEKDFEEADGLIKRWNPGENNYDPRGKLPGSVWTIPTQPLTVPPELGVDHFAAYPMEWPRRIIQGWTPNGICTVCGEGRRPLSDTAYETIHTQQMDRRASEDTVLNNRFRAANVRPHGVARGSTTIIGYTCNCPAPQIPVTFTEFDYELDEMVTRTEMRPDPTWSNPAPTTPSVVCDPFGGTGTTALVAKALGRTGISVDLSRDYCRLAEWRCNDPRELAAALQIEKPEPVHPDQLDLFGESL